MYRFLSFLLVFMSLHVVAQDNCNKKKAAKYADKALLKYVDGKTISSLKLYTKAINACPKSARNYYERALVYKQLNKIDLAFDDFSTNIRYNDVSSRSFFERGSIFLERKEYQLAIADFEKYSEMYPNEEICLAQTAKILMDLGEFEKASGILSHLIQLQPTTIKYLRDRVNCYINTDKLNEAKKDIDKLNEFGDTNWQKFLFEGQYFLKTKAPNKTIDLLKNAIQTDSIIGEHATIRSILSKAFYISGNLDQAIINLNKAIEIEPQTAYYFDRANYLAEAKRMKLALADYTTTIALDSLHIGAYNNRTFFIWFPQKKFQNAVNDLTKIIEIDSTNAFAYSNRSYAYYGLNDLEHAFIDAFKSVEMEQKNPYVYKNLALFYYSIGEIDEATNAATGALHFGFPVKTDNEFENLLQKLEMDY